MNKNNVKNIYKCTTVLLLTGVMTVFTQCVPETTKIETREGSNYAAPSNANDGMDQGQILLAMEVSEGVRNYEEIFVTYSELTGVPVTNDNVRNLYQEIKVSLPTDNQMASFLSGHQVAISKLSAEFCNEMINNTTLRQKIWMNANFGLVKDTAFNQERKDELANKVMKLFWGPSAPAEDKDEMRLVINNLIEDLKAGESNSTAITLEVVKGVCTAALASMYVINK